MSGYFDLVPRRGAGVDWQGLRERFEWIAALDDCPQDPVHHGEGDAGTHVRMVIDAAYACGLDALPEADRRVLFWAVLLHDVAKPATTRMEAGRWRAPGHSRKGQLMARGILWRLGAPCDERERICHLVKHHQIPFYLMEREDWRRRLALISWQTRCDLLELLARADAKGRIAPDRDALLDRVALFGEAAREEDCHDKPRRFESDHARFRFFRDQGRFIDAPAHDDRQFEVILTSGLPASGKSTWIAENAAHLPLVSLDGLREEMGVDAEDAQGPVIQAARERARRHLRAGEPFVWNATAIARRTRDPLISLVDDYKGRVRIIAFEAGHDELLQRNREREAEQRVPEKAIANMVRKWETPDATECHRLTIVASEAAKPCLDSIAAG